MAAVVVAQSGSLRQRPGYRSAGAQQLNGSAREATSDQAPGEEMVQVNDRYVGGGPAPELVPSENDQHQTGG
jgi:hypothetical protein